MSAAQPTAQPSAGTEKHRELIQSIIKAVKDGMSPEIAALAAQLTRIEVAIETFDSRVTVVESMAAPTAPKRSGGGAAAAAPASAALAGAALAGAAPTSGTPTDAAGPATLPKGKKAVAAVAAAATAAAKPKGVPANARLLFCGQFQVSADLRASFGDCEELRQEVAASATPIKHAADSPEYLRALACYVWDHKLRADQKEGKRLELADLNAQAALKNMDKQLQTVDSA
jgi:hypothetical protein